MNVENKIQQKKGITMKKKLTAILVTCFMAAFLAVGCSSQQADKPSDSKKESESASSQENPEVQEIEVPGGYATASGSILSLALEENATTGYTWAVSVEGDTLTQVSDQTFADDSNEEMAGVGGIRLFVYEVAKEGTSKVTLTNAQAWEGGETADTFTLTVDTNDKGNIKQMSLEENKKS